jgi:hypothetical protein
MKNILKKICLILIVPIFVLAFAIACGEPTPAVESVTINGESVVNLKVGESMTFTATVSPAKANQSVEWSIDEGATATEAAVSHTGEFSAGNVPGTAVLRATSQVNSAKSDTVTINITEDEVTVDVKSITIQGDSEVSVKVNQTRKFEITILPEDATNKNVVWSIESGATATGAQIAQDGTFSAGATTGTAVVRVEWEDSDEVYDTVTVNVIPDVQGVTVSGAKEREVLAGASEELSFTTNPAGVSEEHFVWEVIETDLDETEYVLEDGVFYAAENTSGYVVLKVSYIGDSSISDTLIINVNYDIQTKHTVRFFKEDGDTLVYEALVVHGTNAPNPNYYVLGYEVTWDKPLENITENTDFVAELTPIEYTVIYYKLVDGEYQAISINGETSQTVAFGEQATPPAVEDYQVEGKTFINWRIEKEGNTFRLYAEYIDNTPETPAPDGE